MLCYAMIEPSLWAVPPSLEYLALDGDSAHVMKRFENWHVGQRGGLSQWQGDAVLLDWLPHLIGVRCPLTPPFQPAGLPRPFCHWSAERRARLQFWETGNHGDAEAWLANVSDMLPDGGAWLATDLARLSTRPRCPRPVSAPRSTSCLPSDTHTAVSTQP
jgi:hypothetical protein